MTIVPDAGIIDFGTFTPPLLGQDGIQGQVPAPLVGQETWFLSASGWVPAGSAGLGTVTSVDVSGGTTGLTTSGGPVTTSGTITLGGILAVANGGTGTTALTGGRLLLGNGTLPVTASLVADDGSAVTVNGLARFSAPNTSAPEWTTAGINLIQSPATFTDTTSTGTVADIRINNFGSQTLAASNTITVTNIHGTYFNTIVAGTNVTSTGVWALGADSLRVSGGVSMSGNGANFVQFCTGTTTGQLNVGSPSMTGTITLGQSTVSQTTNIQAAATASGSTKTINIGTAGLSGSTTAITIGSNVSGATSTTTLNGRINLVPVGGSAAAWTTSGIALAQAASTWTDTSSTGTVATVAINGFGAQTLAATNAITVNNLGGTYFSQPVAGTNVTTSSRFGIITEGLFCTVAAINAAGGLTVSSGAVLFQNQTTNITANSQTTGLITFGGTGATGTITLGQSTASQTTNIQAGATASGSTKTINIGTGGLSGSTTTIAIGATASATTITMGGPVRLAAYTVATLPAAGTAGRRAYVTDATAPTFLGALTGGGTTRCPVFDNGTAWVAG